MCVYLRLGQSFAICFLRSPQVLLDFSLLIDYIIRALLVVVIYGCTSASCNDFYTRTACHRFLCCVPIRLYLPPKLDISRRHSLHSLRHTSSLLTCEYLSYHPVDLLIIFSSQLLPSDLDEKRRYKVEIAICLISIITSDSAMARTHEHLCWREDDGIFL